MPLSDKIAKGEVKQMTELKKSICDKAYDLIFLLDRVDDEEFVDNIINCLSCNDTVTLEETREEL